MPLSLDERLALASKKFTKACEQIKVLKQQITVNLTMYANFTEMQESPTPTTTTTQPTDGLSLNRNRETLRQKIETLQNFKNIFYMYAHRKADEITKIQCELYGEDTVRSAYDGSTVSTSEQEINESSSSEQEAVEEMATITNSDESWTNNYLTTNYEQEATTQGAHSQLQVTEYDFLTA